MSDIDQHPSATVRTTLPEAVEALFEKPGKSHLHKRERKVHSISFSLAKNSVSSLLSALEIHNKPNIAYRQETVLILLSHAWELLLKAALYKNGNKLIQNYIKASLNGIDDDIPGKGDNLRFTFSKVIELYCVGKNSVLKVHLEKLNKNRNRVMHAYVIPMVAETIVWGLFQKSFELFDEVIEKEFPKLKPCADFPLVLPIGIKKPYNREAFLKSFSDKDVPIFNDLLSSAKILQEEKIDESIIVPISTYFEKKNKVTNADIILAIDPLSENRTEVAKTIRISESGDGTQIMLKPDECRKIFIHPAKKIRKDLSLSKSKKDPRRHLAYQEVIDEKYCGIFWWRDPKSSIRLFSEKGKEEILKRIEETPANCS